MTDVEGPLHRSIRDYLVATLPHGFLVHHCANKPRSAAQGAREKALGAIAGWPDLEIHGRSEDGTPRLWLFEVKPPRTPVPHYQRALHDRLTDIGWPVAVVRSIDDVRGRLRAWRVPSRDAAVAGSRREDAA